MNRLTVGFCLTVSTLALAVSASAADGLLWRHPSTGQNYLHQLNQTAIAAEGFLPTVGTEWSLIASADFNGDGETDLLWRNPATGQNVFELFKNGQHSAYQDFISIGTEWQLATAADFDGDNTADLIWRSQTTQDLYLLPIKNAALVQEQFLLRLNDAAWQVVSSSDFDGDGKADLLFRHATTGANYLFLMNGGVAKSEASLFSVTDLNWQLAATGDLNGDGKADMVWRHTQDGNNYAFMMDGLKVVSDGYLPRVTEAGWSIRDLSDRDNDGKGDLLWYNSQINQVIVWTLNGLALKTSSLLLTAAPDWQLRAFPRLSQNVQTGVVLNSLVVTPGALSLSKGSTQQLVVSGRYSDESMASLSAQAQWTSSNPAVATVNGQGLLTAVALGSTQLTVTAAGKTQQVTVQVQAAAATGWLAYVKKPSDWTKLCTYVWTASNSAVRGQWPGTEIQPDSQLADWYSTELKASELDTTNAINLIFNDCGGGKQSDNLTRTEAQGSGQYDLTTKVWTDGAPDGGQTGDTGIEVTLAVTNGSGAGKYRSGAVVNLTATSLTGKKFTGWTGSAAPYLLNPAAASTQLVLPEIASLSLAAAYEDQVVTDPYVGARTSYKALCTTCHGAQGQGGVGPALTPSLSAKYTAATLATQIKAMTKYNVSFANCDDACVSSMAQMLLAGKIDDTQVSSCSATDQVAQDRRVRLLTRREFQRTLKDLVGLDVDTSKLPEDIPANGFSNNIARNISVSHLESYLDIADLVIAKTNIETLTASSCTASDQACVVKTFGKRAFRRPLTTDEQTRYQTLYSSQGRDGVLMAFLTSPSLLYRYELGVKQTDGRYKLDNYEMASLLSYSFWETMPDDALLAVADSGKLQTKAEIKAQATAMLQNAKAREGYKNFASEWLGINKAVSMQRVEAASDSLYQSMVAETQTFVSDVVFDGSHQFDDLMNAPYSFVNAELAQLYGIAGVTGAALQKVSYPAAQGNNLRRGILGQASVLRAHAAANDSHPIRRGVFVRSLLCQDLPPPPPSVPTLKEPVAGETTRERFARHTSDESCASCHKFIDNLGFGFENFDNMGRYRTTETLNGVTVSVDSRGSLTHIDGELTGTSDTYSFNTLPELITILNSSKSLKTCYVRQYLRYQNGSKEQESDSCAVEAAGTGFNTGATNLYDFMINSTQTEVFGLRK